ncbi:alpha/beta hydrolase fold protein [Stanieria cyanosphaera PCC 7437]|uniref:Alpha/beta hydrolase fold protein n=1 Tax=Stanieria cyanosphaera (strain ATCC 29371 / PCC 7437) TaxID=111780 RepID=K9XTM1_STAC7|nr:alpha/beta hydrolase [Stanieria cyanosphaera]AFZ35012.1 alpha/beta hydrolase fold protein [Stanieria cyanosphaera PCC 7437]
MSSSSNNYSWKNFDCAYQFYPSQHQQSENLALLLIHPIGVGLSGVFWQRFISAWQQQEQSYSIYNPDLLGCGKSEMPHLAYFPEDWAAQLKYFLETVVKQPVVLVVQGALFPVALELVNDPMQPNYIKGLVLSGPPAWKIMTEAGKPLQQKILWNLLFDSPVGNLFYRYARRRKFLQSFSTRQLFAEAEAVDPNWLDFLQAGAKNLDSRYAVFSFLASFWRKDYTKKIQSISQPTLVVFGNEASSISREGLAETPQQRLDLYLNNLPSGQGKIIPGRNVLPYESTKEFVAVVKDFVRQLSILI